MGVILLWLAVAVLGSLLLARRMEKWEVRSHRHSREAPVLIMLVACQAKNHLFRIEAERWARQDREFAAVNRAGRGFLSSAWLSALRRHADDMGRARKVLLREIADVVIPPSRSAS